MVAKISVGNSLYGAIAYNGEKINEAQGRLLTTNRIYNDGSGTVDIGKAMEGFLTFLPPQMKIEKPVVHISLNPHPEDVLTDIELQNIAREYLEKLGFGNQPYLVFKHEDIDRHHLHIVTVNVDENGKRLNRDFLYRRSDRIRRELEQKYGLHPAERKNQRLDNPLRKVAASAGDVKKQVGNTVKALNGQYRFQTMGEYRALLSLYNTDLFAALRVVRDLAFLPPPGQMPGIEIGIIAGQDNLAFQRLQKDKKPLMVLLVVLMRVPHTVAAGRLHIGRIHVMQCIRRIVPGHDLQSIHVVDLDIPVPEFGRTFSHYGRIFPPCLRVGCCSQ